MAFTNSFRLERVYFEKLKSNIDILKSYIEAGATGEALELLRNSVDVDGAVLLLYRNLGEAWAELADLIQKTQKDLKDLAEKTEAYHDELNERIDEVNNYLMALIRELDARLQAVEQDLATMNRNKFYDLIEDDGVYSIEKDGVTVSFDDIKSDADFPHDVILRYDNGTSVTELEIREFTDSRIDFYSIGLADSDKTVKEILVSIADTDAVTYSEHTLENPLYTFGTGLSLDSDNELSVDLNVVQEKLVAGSGIAIDPDTNEITNTAQGATYVAGAGIEIDSQTNQIDVSVGTGLIIDGTDNVIKNTGLFPLYDEDTQFYYKANAMQVGNVLPSFYQDYPSASRSLHNFVIKQSDYNIITQNVTDLPYGYRMKYITSIIDKMLNGQLFVLASIWGTAIIDVEISYKKTSSSTAQSFTKQYSVPFSILSDTSFNATVKTKSREIELQEIIDLSGLYGENLKSELYSFSIAYKITIVGQVCSSSAFTIDSQFSEPQMVTVFNENPIYFYRLDRTY